MEKEDGYDLQERTERVPTETSEKEMGNEEH